MQISVRISFAMVTNKAIKITQASADAMLDEN